MKTMLMFFVSITISVTTTAQTNEASQLLLNYKKLKQLEEILDNMYKGYTILSQGYNRIKDIAEGNYKLHQVFLDGLFAVNPAVRNYDRIPMIISYQGQLMKEYRRAYRRFTDNHDLTASELRYLERVYTYLVNQSVKNLEELTMVVTASKLRMSDDERLKAIDRIFREMENKLSFLRYFNNSTQMLVMQRAKERRAVETMKRLHAIEQ
jgi:hypothetical protein